MAPRSQFGNVHSGHSVAATIRPPEVGMTAIIREWLSWDDYSDKSKREGTFQRKNTLECGVLQDQLTSLVAVSEYYVCGTSVRSNVRKDFQTVPRRIKLSRWGCLFPNLYLNFWHNKSAMIFQNFQHYSTQLGNVYLRSKTPLSVDI